MKRIVALTGAGMSAESGLRTFRDADGLWETRWVEDGTYPSSWPTNDAVDEQAAAAARREARKIPLERGLLYGGIAGVGAGAIWAGTTIGVLVLAKLRSKPETVAPFAPAVAAAALLLALLRPALLHTPY